MPDTPQKPDRKAMDAYVKKCKEARMLLREIFGDVPACICLPAFLGGAIDVYLAAYAPFQGNDRARFLKIAGDAYDAVVTDNKIGEALNAASASVTRH